MVTNPYHNTTFDNKTKDVSLLTHDKYNDFQIKPEEYDDYYMTLDEFKDLKMTYEIFKNNNNTSKRLKAYDVIGKLTDVDFEKDTCTLTVEDNVTPNLPILHIVQDVAINDMGVLSNPSILKRWKGFTK